MSNRPRRVLALSPPPPPHHHHPFPLLLLLPLPPPREQIKTKKKVNKSVKRQFMYGINVRTVPNALLTLVHWIEKNVFEVIVQRRRWCEEDDANISVVSFTSSGRRQRRPDVHKNSVGKSLLRADDWQRNVDVVLVQSQRLECNASQDTQEQ